MYCRRSEPWRGGYVRLKRALERWTRTKNTETREMSEMTRTMKTETRKRTRGTSERTRTRTGKPVQWHSLGVALSLESGSAR